MQAFGHFFATFVCAIVGSGQGPDGGGMSGSGPNLETGCSATAEGAEMCRRHPEKDAGGAARTGTFPTACTAGERLREVRTTVARSTHEERIMKTDVVRQPLMAAFCHPVRLCRCGNGACGASGVPEPHDPLLPEALIMQWRTAWPRFSMLLAGAAIFCSGVILGRQAMRYALYPVSTFITMPLFGLLAAGLLSGPAF